MHRDTLCCTNMWLHKEKWWTRILLQHDYIYFFIICLFAAALTKSGRALHWHFSPFSPNLRENPNPSWAEPLLHPLSVWYWFPLTGLFLFPIKTQSLQLYPKQILNVKCLYINVSTSYWSRTKFQSKWILNQE